MHLRTKKSLIVSILLLILGSVMLFSGADSIYTNLKMDEIDNRGSLKVTGNCEPHNLAENKYRCLGDFRQSVADYHFVNTSAIVTGRYMEGEYVRDLYRDDSVTSESAEDQRFVEGSERRSFEYNVPHVVIAVVGLMALSVLGTAVVAKRLWKIRKK